MAAIPRKDRLPTTPAGARALVLATLLTLGGCMPPSWGANALLHTPPTSDIWIRVRSGGGVVSLVVEDSGRGMPVDLKVGLSLTTDPDGRPAPGSGLLLIERIARLHRGRFRVGDRPGGGARFIVELPASA